MRYLLQQPPEGPLTVLDRANGKVHRLLWKEVDGALRLSVEGVEHDKHLGTPVGEHDTTYTVGLRLVGELNRQYEVAAASAM